jgi:anthranilate phosphoribosyltransferase
MTCFDESLKKISQGSVLSEEEMAGSMREIMGGRVSDTDLASFLTRLAQRGETTDEITGAARVLREKVDMIDAPDDTVDCCGTGGDAAGTYNISTAVALVVAACGVPVAKHGNRAASSKSGAADVLEALGVNLDMPKSWLEQALRNYNFCFLMAPRHHLAMKHVTPVRKALGFRTIFNLLGPLANPAGTRTQLIGVFDQKWTAPMAAALKSLGTKNAWVVHGSDGLDEITLSGPTYVSTLDEDGTLGEMMLTCDDFGLPRINLADIHGGDAAENAAALRALLEGEKTPYRDIVLANAAAVLALHAGTKDLKQFVKKAAEAIDNKSALAVLENYISFSQQGIAA